MLADEAKPAKCRKLGLARKPLDMGAALAELLLDALEAAVEVIDPADHGFALGGKPGDDQRHRSAQDPSP